MDRFDCFKKDLLLLTAFLAKSTAILSVYCKDCHVPVRLLRVSSGNYKKLLGSGLNDLI